jgi:hypothetical protein
MKLAFRVAIVAFAFGTNTMADDAPLPGTQPLEWSEERRPELVMDGAHRFVGRGMREAAAHRRRSWPATLVAVRDIRIRNDVTLS